MATSDDDVCYRGIGAPGTQIRDGRIGVRELTHCFVNRIWRIDGNCRSYARVAPDTAIAEAECADREPASGFDHGVLHGIPVAKKDLTVSKDIITAAGMAMWADHPTITFPTGLSGGLPISAQIIGPHFSESALLRAAHVFQNITDWRVRQPSLPLSGATA